MATLFIVDQSLEGIGGHCYEYAKCLVEAAQQLGLRPVVGANRRFHPDLEFRNAAEVIPAFRRTSYSKYSYLAGLNGVTRQDVDDLWLVPSSKTPRRSWRERLAAQWTYRTFHRRRRQHIQQFASDCELLFRNVVFDEADHAIFTGVSELDLMGLAAYLSNNPRTLQVNWHLLFHFNVFDGRPADYPGQQNRALSLRRSFEAALARIPYHRLSFFATTEALVDQYNRLSEVRFSTLPYPISQTFWEDNAAASQPVGFSSPPQRPLVLTCAGAIRREKGQRQIVQTLVDELGSDLLASGKLCLQVQRPRKRFGFKSKLEIIVPESQEEVRESIHLFDHPLPFEDYVHLIKTTDIGLLAYDPKAYFGRRAGILGEYLCAGRPVIVPAGTWLAEQIATHTQAHVARLMREHPVRQEIDLGEMSWSSENAPAPGGIVTFDSARRPFRANWSLRQGLDAIVFAARWHASTPIGAFCRVELTQRDAKGQVIDRQIDIHDSTAMEPPFRSMVPLAPSAATMSVQCTSAFDDRSLSLRDLRAIGLDAGGRVLPRSAVGLVAAGNEMITAAVRELVVHYPHYRQTARHWSLKFRQSHLPERTIEALLQTIPRRAAQRRAA